MSLRHLRTLLAIAQHGSFAAAARAVHLTHSAVSMQMKALEAELGVALFDRTTRPPALTESARALVPAAEQLVQGYEGLLHRRDEENGAVEGHLRLGAVPSVITGILPPAVAALRRKHPLVHVEVAMALSAELVERLSRRALDAAIVSELAGTPAGFVWTPFLQEPLVLIAPPDAPSRTALELLATYPFIRYTRQAWVGRLIDGLLRRRRIKVSESMTLDTLEAVTAMVAHGLGVSIVPQRGQQVEPPAVAVRTLALPRPTVHRVVGLLYPRRHAKGALAEALLLELEALAGERRGEKARRPRRGAAASRFLKT